MASNKLEDNVAKRKKRKKKKKKKKKQKRQKRNEVRMRMTNEMRKRDSA